MQVTPILRLPSYKPNYRPFSSPDFDERSIDSNMTVVIFELKAIDGMGGLFYECTHCRGCGCPSFPWGSKEIPEEVENNLLWHVELCEGIHKVVAV